MSIDFHFSDETYSEYLLARPKVVLPKAARPKGGLFR